MGSDGNDGWTWTIPDDVFTSSAVMLAFELVFIILGLVMNSWLLASILTSKDLRAGLRNQLLCSMAAVHLLDDVFVSICEIDFINRFLNYRDMIENCAYLKFVDIMMVLSSIVSDCIVAVMACVFLAQVLGISPASKLSPRHVKLGKRAVLLFPWVLAVIASPLSVNKISVPHWILRDCEALDYGRYHLIESVFTVTPLCVATLVTGTALILRYTRSRPGRIPSLGSVGVQQTGSGPEIDSSLAYIGVLLVCVACEMGWLIKWYQHDERTHPGFVFETVVTVLEAARSALLPPVFLLFTDIRQRVRAWRPCGRTLPGAGIDLRVAYNREE